MGQVGKERLRALEHKVTTLEGLVQRLSAAVDLTRNGVGSIASGVAQNLAGIKANLDANSDAMEQLDIFNQIWSKMFLKVIEQIQVSEIDDPSDMNSEHLAVVKAHAQDLFTSLFNECKDRVREEREAYLKELRARADAEMKAQEQAKKEESVAEATLRDAESRIATLGGQGSDPPPEAEIFGG